MCHQDIRASNSEEPLTNLKSGDAKKERNGEARNVGAGKRSPKNHSQLYRVLQGYTSMTIRCFKTKAGAIGRKEDFV